MTIRENLPSPIDRDLEFPDKVSKIPISHGFTKEKILLKDLKLIAKEYLKLETLKNAFSSLILNFYTNPIIILLDLLFLSLFSSILLKFGRKMEKVKEATIKLFTKINSILIFSEVIILLFLFFFNLISMYFYIESNFKLYLIENGN